MAEESDEKREERAKSSTSQKELEKLAEDKDYEVRSSLAENANTPVSLLEKIPQKSDKDIYKVAQYFLKTYFITRDGLKEINVIRTNKLAHAEYAEWLISKIFDGQVAKNTVQEGYDVISNNKEIKYEVKSRLVNELTDFTAFHVRVHEKIKFDYLACVFLSKKYEVLGFFTMKYDDWKEYGVKDKRINNRISLIWSKKNRKIYEKYIKWEWKREWENDSD